MPFKEKQAYYILSQLKKMKLIGAGQNFQESKKIGGGFKANIYPIINPELWEKYFEVALRTIKKAEKREGKLR